jgi:hypothetical protein
MGKLKAIFWFLVVAFVIYSFGAWLFSGEGNLSDLARSAGGFFGDAKDALGIFFSELFK